MTLIRAADTLHGRDHPLHQPQQRSSGPLLVLHHPLLSRLSPLIHSLQVCNKSILVVVSLPFSWVIENRYLAMQK